MKKDENETCEVEETLVENDLGEELSENHLMEIAKKVRMLDEKRIDELFFDCGFKEKTRGKNRSLSAESIMTLKKNNEEAFGWMITLFQETPKEDFLYAVRNALALPIKIEFDEEEDEED